MTVCVEDVSVKGHAVVRPINFVYHSSPNYLEVQRQIFGLITEQLGDHPTSTTMEERRSDAINFGIFIRKGRGKDARPMPLDVLMSHGLADKGYLLAPSRDGSGLLVNAYEHILVPGAWFRNRLIRRKLHPFAKKRVRVKRGNIHAVGWPRLDPLLALNSQQEPTASRKLRLLWAPSHNVSTREQSFSSYPAFEPYLDALADRFDVRVSLHPRNRTDKSPTAGDLPWADVVISDFGTMLYEAFALDKCVIMPTWLLPDSISQDRRHRRTAEGHIYRHRLGNHAESFEHLVELATSNQAPQSDIRTFMASVLDADYRGRSAARVADLLKTLPLARPIGS